MKTEAALAAQMIRKELKNRYSSIKFSVCSSNYSMGSTVSINWVDGPEAEKVDSIVRKYQYGNFDGMTDSYLHSNLRKDIPQAMFINCYNKRSN